MKCSAVQYSAVMCSTVQWCAVQCSAVLYTAVKACDVRLGPFPGRNWLYSKALHCTSVQCRSLHCSVRYCIAVHWTVFSAGIYCTAHCKPVCMSTSSSSKSWQLLYLEYFFHIKLDLRLVIVDRNKLHFTSFKYLSGVFNNCRLLHSLTPWLPYFLMPWFTDFLAYFSLKGH